MRLGVVRVSAKRCTKMMERVAAVLINVYTKVTPERKRGKVMKGKRIFSLLLCVAMVVGLLSGCSTLNSVATVEGAMESEKMAGIMADVEARKEAILASETAIVRAWPFTPGETYTGTAYYISNNGSDYNSGRSPNAPLATLEPLHHRYIRSGDIIFFERGGTWRCQRDLNVPGVTYSAYGEGEKPKLYGSSQNGGGEEKWTLHHEGEDGEKIWVFHEEMTEVGAIILNGETVVPRDVAHWNGADYQKKVDDGKITDDPYLVEEDLADMTCFPMLNYPEQQDPFERIFWQWNEWTGEPEYVKGPLYFRCDEGNPGALYPDIEFVQPYPFSDGFAPNAVYDNLCYAYSGMGMCSGEYDGKPPESVVIQNCEIAWMGGLVTRYATGDPEIDGMFGFDEYFNFHREGGILSITGSNSTVRNNYLHGSFAEGVSLRVDEGQPSISGNQITGNLLEDCMYGILLTNWNLEPDPEHMLVDCSITDNIVLACGANYLGGPPEKAVGEAKAIVMEGGPCANQGLVVQGNTFALSKGPLIQIERLDEVYTKVFQGNTYAQYTIGTGFRLLDRMTESKISKSNVETYLGDDAATVIR